MKNCRKNAQKSSNGITLIALVITIIVLLILDGISISMLSGDNSILQKATDAKKGTVVGQEKETIALAYNSALAKKVSNGNSDAVTDIELNDELNNSEATASGNPIIITFTKTGNAYEIDSQGVIKQSTPKDPSATLKVADKKTKNGESVIAISTTETTTLEDDLGNEVKVPKGFGIAEDSGTKVEEGIVIEYVGTNADDPLKGNQYVWIPVGTEIIKTGGTKIPAISLGRYNFDAKPNSNNTGVDGTGLATLVQDAANWQIETKLTPTEMTWDTYEYSKDDSAGSSYNNSKSSNLSAFITSATNNHGYYIARYEAGSGSTKPLSKKDKETWTQITQPNAAIACQDMHAEVNSDLVNSYAWDTAIVYIQKCTGSDEYSKQNRGSNIARVNTGITGDEQCKINDMAKNVSEWTTESSTCIYGYDSYPCVLRGGDGLNESSFTAYRDFNGYRDSSDYIGFRPLLYL